MTTSALRSAVDYVSEHPHRVDHEELAAILASGIDGSAENVDLPELCALVAGEPEPSDAFTCTVVQEETVETQPEGLLISDHDWPPKFSRRDGAVPRVAVYSLPKGRIAMSPRSEVVLDHAGRHVPDVSAAPHLAPLYRNAEVEPISGRLLVAGTPGSRMFSHWLFDVLPRIEAARLAGYDIEAIDHVLVQSRPSDFTQESLERLGFRADQIIYGRGRVPFYQADELIVPTGVRTAKYTPAWVRAFIRRLFLGEDAPAPEPTRKVVYISRQDADRRSIVGHELLDPFLDRTEAITLHPEEMNIAEVAAELSDAALLLGPHGAGLANGVFLPPWAAGMEFFGVHFMPEYFQLLSATTSHYVLVTGDDEQGRDVFDPASLDDHRRAPRKETRWQDIVLNPERTTRALEWAESHLDTM